MGTEVDRKVLTGEDARLDVIPGQEILLQRKVKRLISSAGPEILLTLKNKD